MGVAEFIPGLVLGLREGLEAFLIIGIMQRFLGKLGRTDLQGSVRTGFVLGVVGSAGIGLALWALSSVTGADSVGTIWESLASLAGLILLSTFIYWMMKHGRTVVGEVRSKVEASLSRAGLTGLATTVVLREGAEIALFAFSAVNQQVYLVGVFVGIIAAAVLAVLISRSLVRVNLAVLFTVTLAYLVLQAGYLFGYSVHELLSALAGSGALAADSALLVKAFNLSATILDHSSGALGVALNVLVGWYSRPEWLPLLLHYGYVASLFIVWRHVLVRGSKPEAAAHTAGPKRDTPESRATESPPA